MSFRLRRRDYLSGIGAVGVGGLAGCVDDLPGVGTVRTDEGTSWEDRTIKLGVIQPLSGDLEPFGEPLSNAATLPIEQLEAKELPIDFEHEVKDSETDPETGVTAGAALVDEGYPMINGAANSDVTIQLAKQALIPYRTVCCSPASTSPTITSLNDGGFVFRTVASDALQGVALAKQAVEDLGHSSAATLYVNNDYGWQLSQAFTRTFENEYDGTVTAEVPIEEERDGYVDELEAAREGGPELLVVIAYPETGIPLFQDFYETGGDEDVLVPDGLRDPDVATAVGESMDEVRGTAPRSDGPGLSFFEEQYEAAYDESPGIYTANSYDASAVLLLANAYAGQNDGPAIANAVRQVTDDSGEEVGPETLAEGLERAARGEEVSYRGASSDVVFDENGDIVDATYEYWRFDESDDGFETLDDEVTV
ncbi:ABC transporter substrate-binding protein [Natrialbaceae archaeon GCM10025810]|uniref:ABC transporter substrate-binding protein n=1 Tax=Halovalidus salilacus TaxID=3075124 RepID=UPI00360D5EAE